MSLVFLALARLSLPQIPPDAPIMHQSQLLQRARHLYRTRHYREAYRLFAFEPLESNIVCREYRIKCLLAIGEWRAALEESKLMIELYPTNSQWHLIAADVCLTNLQYRLAQQILQEALLIVSNDDSHYADLGRLERVAYQGMLEMAGGKYIDVFGVLPHDLILDIFGRLSLDSLARATRVSRQWREYLINTPQLWHNLDFGTKNNSRLSTATINTYLGRLNNTPLTHLRIHHEQPDGDWILDAISLQASPRLHTLGNTRPTIEIKQ
ncbi:hypothetical protein CLU79DRAFT_772921 [Phycomyces nitens]|nr:hypothetical protein CLU79DRAFT_772921 [Phycomyces nitens]